MAMAAGCGLALVAVPASAAPTATAPLAVIQTIPTRLGAPATGAEVSPDGTRLYVTSGTGRLPDAITQIDLGDDTVLGSFDGGNTIGSVPLSPNGATAYIGHSDETTGTGSIDEVSTATRTVTRSVPTASGVQGLSVTPAGQLWAVLDAAPNSISVIDPDTGVVGGTLPYRPTTAHLVFSGSHAFIPTATGVVEVVTATGAFVRTIDLGGVVSALAANPAGTLLVAAVDGSSTVAFINPFSGGIVHRFVLRRPPGDGQLAFSADDTELLALNLTTPVLEVVSLVTGTDAQAPLRVTANALTTSIAVGPDGRDYVTDVSGTISVIAPQGTQPPPAAPSVTEQPADQQGYVGQRLTFTAAAFGNPTPTVQWQYSTDHGTTWRDIPGATSTTYVTAPLVLSENGTRVRAVFANASGTAATSSALVTVTKPRVGLGLEVDPQPVAFGATITVTAHVVPGIQTSKAVTGAVTFSGLGVPGSLTTVPVVNGVATFTTGGPAAGASEITAKFGGDPFFADASTSVGVAVGGGRLITGTYSGGLVVAGGDQLTLRGAHVTGQIYVDGSGAVDIENSTVDQGIVALGPGAIRVCGSTVGGQLTVAYATGWVLAGASADGCAANTLTGPVKFMYDSHGLQAYGNSITGVETNYLNSGSGPFPRDTAPHVDAGVSGAPCNVQCVGSH